METPNHSSLFDRMRSHRLASAFTILTAVTGVVVAGSLLTHDVGAKEQQHLDSSDAHPLVIPNPVTLGNGFSQIVKQVGPAVVNINTESIPKQAKARPGRSRTLPQGHPGTDGDGSQPNSGDMQDFFNKFFGGQGGGGDDDGDGSMGGERQALGSGFIVDPRGYILTNNHVVEGATRIYVKLAGEPDDGTSRMQGHPATVVGVDTETDIAVIKIDASSPLPTIKLGNSDGAQVGDWVLAIGSPFNLSQTVSAGIVSAKDRAIDDRESGGAPKQFQRFIQTDAAINPGNSGGPLVDMTGSVIGMNTAIYTQSGSSAGIGFAMPSVILAKVYNDLISPSHKVVRGSLGLTFQAATSSAVGRVYGFQSGGVIVTTVSPSGGAAKAGIKPGDILVSVGGHQIKEKDGTDLVNDVSARPVGSQVEIGYLRDKTLHTATVTVGDRAKVYAEMADKTDDTDQTQQPDAGQSKLGITVTALPQSAASKMGIQGGVTVKSVTPGSFADDIGLGPGALIVEINRMPVTDESSYRSIVSKIKTGDDVVFVVRDPRGRTGNTFVGGTLR
jgi:serine protease Do